MIYHIWGIIGDAEKLRGEPVHPQRQIEAIDKSIERYQKDIEYWRGVQDRF